MRVGRRRRGPCRAAFVGAALLGLVSGVAHAEDTLGLRKQRFEVAGFIGYAVGGDFDLPRGRSDLDDGASYAGMVALRVWQPMFVEFMYSRRPTSITFHSLGGMNDDFPDSEPEQDEFVDVGLEFYQLGLTYRWYSPYEWLTPLVGVSLGSSRVDAGPDTIEDSWHFAFMPIVGVQFDLHPNFGIRAQGRLPLTVVTQGGTVFCGGAPSCDVGSNDTLTVQGDMQLGLVLKL
jgi:opacity protein-like surface antigen